jgi:RNA polymerase sigma factor (TIGR02999 family)
MIPDAKSGRRTHNRGMGGEAHEITQLLRAWQGGDRGALDELVSQLYGTLRQIAARQLGGERAGHTLRPTDLIGEAYLRLAGGQPAPSNDRVHFFAIAARTMRQILVDRARARCADKRGGGERPVTLDEDLLGERRSEDLVALDQALDALATFDARKARIVELAYFGGLTQPEIALVLEVHVNTVARDLRLAEAWLHNRLAG